jgi:hypothetical protein
MGNIQRYVWPASRQPRWRPAMVLESAVQTISTHQPMMP